ncbi:DUF7692 domain-containing protein [Salinibaculum salinum]
MRIRPDCDYECRQDVIDKAIHFYGCKLTRVNVELHFDALGVYYA